MTEHSHMTNRIGRAPGKLIYLAMGTRPDISFAVSVLSRHLSAFGKQHWEALKHVLRYLKATTNFGITFKNRFEIELIGYLDADWAGDISSRRSISASVFLVNETPVAWDCKLQSMVALSSTEAEYMAATQGTKTAIHLRVFLNEIGYLQEEPTLLNEDNQPCIALTKNPVHHARTKHLDIQLHFVRQQVEKKVVTLAYCPTEVNIADLLTKPLPRVRFEQLRENTGVHPIVSSS